LRDARGKFVEQGILLREVAHEELLDLQATGIPPRYANKERVRARAAREAGRFRVEEKPLPRILERGACFAGERFVGCPREQVERDRGRLGGFRGGKPVSNGEMFAETVARHACAEELSDGIFFVRCAQCGRLRRNRTRWLQRQEPRKFIGGRGHLSTQPLENRERGFFCTWRK